MELIAVDAEKKMLKIELTHVLNWDENRRMLTATVVI
jgi:hypothetical protein